MSQVEIAFVDFEPQILVNKVHDVLCKHKNIGIQTKEDTQLLESLAEVTHHAHLHAGTKRLKMVLQSLFPKKTFTEEIINKTLKNCDRCASQQRLLNANKIGKMVIPKKVGQIVAIDHYTPFPQVTSLHKKKTILSVKDIYSKFVSLFPMRSYGHGEIVEMLRIYIQQQGDFEVLRLDNALDSQEIKSFCIENGILLIPTPIYRPQANGQVERLHRDLEKYFRDMMKVLGLTMNRWYQVVHRVVVLINSIPHSVTKMAPKEIQHLSNDKSDPKIKAKHEEIYQRLEKQQNKQVSEKTGPFPKTTLPAKTKVWIWTKTSKIPAIVISDCGDICHVRKLYEGRFQHVSVHKNMLSVRRDETCEVDEFEEEEYK